MVLCKVSNLVGNEILARSVLSEDYNIILSEGTVLKKSYIDKLIELGIQEVAIKEDENMEKSMSILKEDIADSFREKVQDILERHTYNHSDELEKLSTTANEIISNILEKEEVVEKVYDIRERSADIYEHSISICTLATLTALKLEMSQEDIYDISMACLLHDLGLRYLTISYQDQDVEQLNDMEKVEYKKHPVYGYSALKSETWISEKSKQMILYHHERLDGSGFPLRAKDISKQSRLIQICDCFDEMICGIGCKRSKVYEAVEYLKNLSGIKFDQEIVETFLTFIAVYPLGSRVKLDSGEMAVVVKQNKQFPERPVVELLTDKDGNPLEQKKELNLMEVLNVVINQVMD